MNREIKFRGLGSYLDYDKKSNKYIKKTKWIYGSVIFGGGGEFPKTAQIWNKEGHNYSVEPESVGQYTGIKDKNKVESYDGDILAKKGHRNRIIVWEKDAWVCKYADGSEGLYRLHTFIHNAVIIGNIYKNKELKIWDI